MVTGIKGRLVGGAWFLASKADLVVQLFTDQESLALKTEGFHGAWLSVLSIHISQRQKWQCSCVAVCNIKSLS